MTRVNISVLFICFYICKTSGLDASDYFYWREYTGAIPPDALPGGKDPDGRDTYIGEGYIHGHGYYIASIYPGLKELDVPCYGVKTAATNIKILCTDTPEFFRWIKTSATTYGQDVANLKVVKAGFDYVGDKDVMNVGRIFYQGYVVVGEVTPFVSRKGNVQLWFPFRKVERPANLYELLIFDVPQIDERLGKNYISTYTRNVTRL